MSEIDSARVLILQGEGIDRLSPEQITAFAQSFSVLGISITELRRQDGHEQFTAISGHEEAIEPVVVTERELNIFASENGYHKSVATRTFKALLRAHCRVTYEGGNYGYAYVGFEDSPLQLIEWSGKHGDKLSMMGLDVSTLPTFLSWIDKGGLINNFGPTGYGLLADYATSKNLIPDAHAS